jgi:hypothetical protein
MRRWRGRRRYSVARPHFASFASFLLHNPHVPARGVDSSDVTDHAEFEIESLVSEAPPSTRRRWLVAAWAIAGVLGATDGDPIPSGQNPSIPMAHRASPSRQRRQAGMWTWRRRLCGAIVCRTLLGSSWPQPPIIALESLGESREAAQRLAHRPSSYVTHLCLETGFAHDAAARSACHRHRQSSWSREQRG